MSLPRRKRGSIGLQTAAALGALTALIALRWAGMPAALLPAPPGPHVGLDEAAAAVMRNAQLRGAFECVVVIFQVAGVFMLCLSRLCHSSPWADRGRFGFVGSMVGLGAAGTLCAWYASEFALFAGVTMAILLNIVILWSTPAHGAKSQPLPLARETYMAA